MRSLTTPHRKAAELVTVTDGTSTADGGIDALNAQAAAGAGEADGALAAAHGLV
jgi:hypothetical protein